MTRQEVDNLLEKVQAYRQSFLITKMVIAEWRRVLEPYDSEDVNKKLDEFFRNSEENFGKYPDVCYLTKYLKKHDEKLKAGINYVRCQICQQPIELTEYDKHYDRCSSIEYLCKIAEKHYNRKLNKEELRKLSDKDFEEKYWKVCEELQSKTLSEQQKYSLENALSTHKDGKLHDFKISNTDISHKMRGEYDD